MSGFFWILLASCLWATAATVAKVSFHESVSPLLLTAVRSLLAAVVFGMWNVIRAVSLRLTPTQLRLVIAQGVAISVMSVAYYEAIRTTNVAIAVMLEYTAPLWVALYQWIRGRERLRLALVGLLSLAMASGVLLVGGSRRAVWQVNLYGAAMGIVSAWAFAAYVLLGAAGHRLQLSSRVMLGYAFAISAFGWAVLFSSGVITVPPVHAWPALPWGLLVFIGLGGTVLPFWCQLQGLRTFPPMHATLLGMVEPLIAALLAYGMFGESFAWPQLIGMVGVGTSVVLLQRDRLRACAGDAEAATDAVQVLQ
ncbi:MAG: EamA family transporter [Deltaproteobacteria bacterium]|nr:EamA family transporter [Deltaproteobacteria bacterium]